MSAAPPDCTSRLWAITCYFNPLGSRRRRVNYAIFRQRLALPLVATALSFDGCGELREGDAEIVLHCDGGDVMWQKERLLNLALAALPAACEHVLWVDCDVIFQRPDLQEAIRRK